MLAGDGPDAGTGALAGRTGPALRGLSRFAATRGIPPASRGLLGVPGTATTERAFQAAYRRVRYCFHAIVSVADPSALPKNRRLTAGELKARTKAMTPGQAAAARDRLEALVNALLEASVSILSEDERAASGGGTGLDATPVPLFSRGPSRRTGLSASDPARVLAGLALIAGGIAVGGTGGLVLALIGVVPLAAGAAGAAGACLAAPLLRAPLRAR